MRKFVLALLSLFVAFGLTVAAKEVVFVSFKDDKLTVKEGDAEKTYTVSDKTTFKFGEKEADATKAKGILEKAKAGKTKLDISVDGSNVTEIKFVAGKKKKTDK